MSDCGVCIDSGFDYEENSFMSEDLRKARKQHLCCECGKKIEVGEKYNYARGRNDNGFWQNRTCEVCAEIRSAFCCNGWIYGNLWDGMHEIMRSLTSSCFDRLSSPAAKQELRRRWMNWRGIAA